MPPRGFNQYQQGQYQQTNPYQRNQRQQQNPNMRQNQYQQNQYRQNQQQMPQYQINPYLLNGYQQQFQQQPAQSVQQQPQQTHPQMPGQHQQQQQPQDPAVTYEQIDADTLNEIRASLGEPKYEPKSEQGVTVYALNEKVAESIGIFAQNEKNASIFYKNLSEISHNDRQKRILSKISEVSKKHIKIYQDIYKQLVGNDYELKEAKIITSVDFYDGIRFAILEETGLLDELNDLYDQIPDEKSLKSLNKMMNRKISSLNYLRNLQI